MKKYLLAIILALCPTLAFGASVLQTAASTLAVGSSVEITGSNINSLSGLLYDPIAGSTDYITQNSTKMSWDPVNKQLWYGSGAHGSVCCYGNLIKYDAATNTWSAYGSGYPIISISGVSPVSPQPTVSITPSAVGTPVMSTTITLTAGSAYFNSGHLNYYIRSDSGGYGRIVGFTDSTHITLQVYQAFPSTATITSGTWNIYANQPYGFAHSYQHDAVDGARGEFYHRGYYGTGIHRYTMATGVWDTLGATGGSFSWGSTCCGAVEYFPDMDGVFVQLGAFGETGIYSRVSSSWTMYTAPSGWQAGNYTNIAVYHPKLHKILVGGGIYTALWLFDKTGTFTNVNAHADTPSACNGVLSGGSSNQALIAADPNTSKFLIICSNSSSVPQWYTFDPLASSGSRWASMSTPSWYSPKENGNNGMVVTTIPEFGVIAFLDVQSATSKLWLYKLSENSFATRCAQTGMQRCFGFDTDADRGTIGSGAVGQNYGTFHNGQTNCNTNVLNDSCPTIDTTTAASGAGSLKMSIASQANPSQQWFTNFSTDLNTQYGENTDFWVQWRQRFNSAYLADWFETPGGAYGSWKQVQIGTGDIIGTNYSSCSYLELVTTNTLSLNYPIMYNACNVAGASPTNSITLGATSGSNVLVTANSGTPFDSAMIGWVMYDLNVPGLAAYATIATYVSPTQVRVNMGGTAYSSTTITSGNWAVYPAITGYGGLTETFSSIYNGSDLKQQNARISPYCLYSAPRADKFSPTGNCFGYVANEWMTFKVRVKPGRRLYSVFADSYVELWAARENGAFERLIDLGPIQISAGPVGDNQKFGKAWLSTYITNIDTSLTHSEAITWFDEFSVGTIDPGYPALVDSGSSGDVTNPTIVITSPTSSSTYTSTSSTITLSGTASDDQSLSQVTWTNDLGGSGTATGTTSWSVSSISLAIGANVITVYAVDAAGNVGSDQISVSFLPPAAPTGLIIRQNG